MTSGQFASVPLSSITISRDSRQRRKVSEDHVAMLAESIAARGLINPPVITRDGKLVAGETRVLAMRQLGWTSTPVQWQDELDPSTLKLIELEENIKRKDIAWEDACLAMQELHATYSERPGWTLDKTAEEVGLKKRQISNYLAVAKELVSGNALVKAAPKLTTAINIVERKSERARADEIVTLRAIAEPDKPAEEKILVADFLEWSQTYSGEPFNLLHCDFPYGVNADKFNQGAAKEFGGYADTEDYYWNLVAALINNHKRLLGDSAHIIFWFSMDYYEKTRVALSSVFRVDARPLIWNKVNVGIIPDPKRSPRWVYETAFFCSLGDRKIIRSVPNVSTANIERTGAHMSEKSSEMLKHFFQMVVDENTRILDPTCGSASALRAAESLGAKRVLGLELNPEFAENAKLAMLKGA